MSTPEPPGAPPRLAGRSARAERTRAATGHDAPPRVDGRSARAERTRAAIVDAHLALIREGDLKPTGERIAERAGVSLRALWANFRDLESLFAATADRVFEQVAAEHRPVAPDLPRAERIEAFCGQRARALELIGPSARAARLREPFSPALRRSRAGHVSRVREELASVFASELATAVDGERVLDGLTVATTFAAWSILRDELGLDAQAAQAVMARMVAAILAAV